MKPETVELVRYRLARAHESLAEARLLLANDHERAAVNRVYYGCFYVMGGCNNNLMISGVMGPLLDS